MDDHSYYNSFKYKYEKYINTYKRMNKSSSLPQAYSSFYNINSMNNEEYTKIYLRRLKYLSHLRIRDVLSLIAMYISNTLKHYRTNISNSYSSSSSSNSNSNRKKKGKKKSLLLVVLAIVYHMMIQVPLAVMYHLYITIPSDIVYAVIDFVFTFIIRLIDIDNNSTNSNSCSSSNSSDVSSCTTASQPNITIFNRIIVAVYILSTYIYTTYNYVINVKISDLFFMVFHTLCGRFLLWIYPITTSLSSRDDGNRFKDGVVDDIIDGHVHYHDALSNTISYEEYDNTTADGGNADKSMTTANSNSNNRSDIERRMKRVMHHYVPPKPFKATVRVSRSAVYSRNNSKVSTPSNHISLTPIDVLSGSICNSCDTESLLDLADSPLSFPSTPLSRAKVLNRSSERVDSIMFAARDRLRMEAQSYSHDDFSRSYANKSRQEGQYAIFDQSQASDGIMLTCGNHCIVKVKKSLCCSCKAMMPVPLDTYIYLEFSITAACRSIASGAAFEPSLCIGFSTGETPLNVMVGSWSQSIGLYSDGQLLIDSRWYSPESTNGNNATSYVSRSSISGSSSGGSSSSSSSSSSRSSSSSSNTSSNSRSSSSSSHSTKSNDNSTTRTTSKDDVNACIGKAGNCVLTAGTTVGFLLYIPSKRNSNSSSSTSSNIGGSIGSSIMSGLHDLIGTASLSDSHGSRNAGDTVSSSLSTTPTTAAVKATEDKLLLKININGTLYSYSREAYDAMHDALVSHSDDAGISGSSCMYPTVSLLSENTKVWCRFCEADIIRRNRDMIGAPLNVRVYSLDGSLLLSHIQ